MADGFGGTYIFASLADFAAGRPNTFRQAFGHVGTDFGVTSIGGFFTDKWSVTKKLTLDPGFAMTLSRYPRPFARTCGI